MTEEEKRALALDFLAAEKQRLKSSTFRDHRAAYEAETHERIASRQRYYDAFAQQGITFREFQKAYNDAYEQGRSDMLAYRFSFFYAATAIAYSEIFAATPEETASFMKALPRAPEGCTNHAELVQRCVDETGFDPSFADERVSHGGIERLWTGCGRQGLLSATWRLNDKKATAMAGMNRSSFLPATRRWRWCFMINIAVDPEKSNPSSTG